MINLFSVSRATMMSFRLLCLGAILLLGCGNDELPGTILFQRFESDPFDGQTITTDYAKNVLGCKWPSYRVDSPFDAGCSRLNNPFTGDGNFLIIDNDAGSQGVLYGESDLDFSPGTYFWFVSIRPRFGKRPNYAPEFLKLEFQINGSTYTSTKRGYNHKWQQSMGKFELTEAIKSATVTLVQTNTGMNMDYGLDNFIVVREKDQ
ncbi:MAG: hypothetical protein AAF998_02000 [Bacteroidota bacterium]